MTNIKVSELLKLKSIEVRPLLKYTMEGNKLYDNKFYSEVLVEDIGLDSLSSSSTHYEYFRIDSSTGKIYSAWFDNDSLLSEELYSDLLAEVGDTIPIGNGIYLESEVPFSLLGLSSLKRTFLKKRRCSSLIHLLIQVEKSLRGKNLKK